MGGMPDEALPRVAVFYEDEAFSPMEIAEAARGRCALVWVIGWGPALDNQSARLLPRLGTVVDVAGLTGDAIDAALVQASVAGVTVFSDLALEPAAAVAHRLGLRFHSPETARRLRDKLRQREALRAAGLPGPVAVGLDSHAGYTAADAAAIPIRWPAVLKPRRGSGGRDVFLISGPEELPGVLATWRTGEELVLEEYLPGRTEGEPQQAADLVSAELIVVDGVPRPIAISSRFPLEPPLREPGGFLPSHLDAADTAAVFGAAADAAAAIGVRHGALHIEFKLTVGGPRVVEVNGRVGGIVPVLLAAVGGPPLISWALQIALGRAPEPIAPIVGGPVAFYYRWLAPAGAFRITAVGGVAEVMAMAEVDRMWIERGAGAESVSRDGSSVAHLADAHGTVASLEALWPVAQRLREALRFELEPLAQREPRQAGDRVAQD